MKIEFVTEPDETGKGRIVVDGKFYGLPVDAVRELMETRETLQAVHNELEYGDVYQWDGGQSFWQKMRDLCV